MVWEFLERWKGRLQLAAVAAGGRDETTSRVRDAFGEAGAWITDVHFFSGVQTVFTFETDVDRLATLRAALEGAGLVLDAESTAALEAAAAQGAGEAQGTLAVVFVHGDPDLTHEVPAVPG